MSEKMVGSYIFSKYAGYGKIQDQVGNRYLIMFFSKSEKHLWDVEDFDDVIIFKDFHAYAQHVQARAAA